MAGGSRLRALDGSATLGGFGYTGEQHDAESGLVYLRVRHYDPGTGRFLQQDSYGGSLTNPASQHLYGYELNNPLRYTDPSGHCADAMGVARSPGCGVPGFIPAPQLPNPGNIVKGIVFGIVTGAATWLGHTCSQPLGRSNQPVQPYEVGEYNDLKNRSRVGDGLDIHHVPQKHPADQLIPGYVPETGSGIALPEGEHEQMPTKNGPYSGTPGELIEGDLEDVKNYTNAPQSAMDELEDLIDRKYPG